MTTKNLSAHSKERVVKKRNLRARSRVRARARAVDQQRALVWAMFAAAEVSRSVEYARSVVDCAKVADGMLAESG